MLKVYSITIRIEVVAYVTEKNLTALECAILTEGNVCHFHYIATYVFAT